MSAASATALPASKVLAEWWKDLAPRTPRGIWIAHLLLHCIDALASLVRPAPLDSLELFVLRAVAVSPRATPRLIAEQLELPAAFVQQVLRRLSDAGLVHDENGSAWPITPAGSEAINNGIYGRPERQRRSFYFVDNETTHGRPEYVKLLNHPALATWPNTDAWHFDTAILKECVQQPAEWKRQRGFPEEIVEIVDAAMNAHAGAPAAENWRSIILDQPRHFLALLLILPAQAGGESLFGFAVGQDGWTLQMDVPVFQLTPPWQHVFPDLAPTPLPDDCRQAWRTWCQERGLLSGEAEAFELEYKPCILRVSVAAPFLRSLRATASEALRGEDWLLVGNGRIRTAARLEFTEIGA
jgi:hypothetical protein